jgi:hypothetical protein
MNDVMVDLETLDNTPTSVIVSIGAVRMNLDTLKLEETFTRVVDPRSQPTSTVGADTVMWWFSQSQEARAAIFDSYQFPIKEVLNNFNEFLHTKQNGERPTIWGNGANFDNVILRNAYRACGLEAPWPYWNDRCYRTARALLGDKTKAKSITAHNALADAKQQAEQLLEMLGALRARK